LGTAGQGPHVPVGVGHQRLLLGDRRGAGADRGHQLRPARRGAGRRHRLSDRTACLLLRADAALGEAASSCVKRRGLLLGALLMPTAARAKTPKQAPKKAAAPPPPPSGPQPLKEAKSQLVAFNASAFPYRGVIPGTNKPFLDAKDGKRRGHTTSKG